MNKYTCARRTNLPAGRQAGRLSEAEAGSVLTREEGTQRLAYALSRALYLSQGEAQKKHIRERVSQVRITIVVASLSLPTPFDPTPLQHRDTQETLTVLDRLDLDTEKPTDEELARKFGFEEAYYEGSLTWWQKLKPQMWSLFDEPYTSVAAKVRPQCVARAVESAFET